MTRALLLANGIAALAGAAGLGLLARPRTAARALRLPAGEAADYGLRIAGAMLFAAALFLAGFSTMFAMTAPA
jgi:hypothetical protein